MKFRDFIDNQSLNEKFSIGSNLSRKDYVNEMKILETKLRRTSSISKQVEYLGEMLILVGNLVLHRG